MVIGKGPEREALEQLADRLGVADRVEFLGALPHERALEEMARGHIHAMPSSHEPFGVAHIEAMAAGLVAIGGAGTGAQDIADAGEGIVLVPPGDETALAREIDRLVADAGSGSGSRRPRAPRWRRTSRGSATASGPRPFIVSWPTCTGKERRYGS